MPRYSQLSHVHSKPSGDVVKTIQAKAGQPTKILSRFSNSITTTYSFSAAPTGGEDAPSGTVEVKGSNWIFPKLSTTQPLEAENSVTKSAWDVFFSVHVTPDQDVTIQLERGKKKWPLLLAALVVGIIAAAAILMFVGSGG